MENEVLSFEAFTAWEKGAPPYNNFFLYFFDVPRNPISEIYRRKEHFVAFKEREPGLERKITSMLTAQAQSRIGTKVVLQPLEPDLYQAYVLMRQYGVSDEVLFR